MAYAFNDDKSKVEVLPASNTYTKNEVYTKSETSSVLESYVTRAIADAPYVPQTSTSLVPAGAITQFAGTSAPAGWLLCNGQSVSKSSYSALFSVIGYTYGGSGDTFNLPDLRGKFPIGKSSSHALASTGGAEKVTLTESEIPSHIHGLGNSSYGNKQVAVDGGTSHTVFGASSTTTENYFQAKATGGGEAHENMPPYITLNYIIKY